MIENNKWFEIWYSDGFDVIPTYLLLVVSDGKTDQIMIVDPIKNNEVKFSHDNYDEICAWLWEDEYQLVTGREVPDD